jgi:Flp pilus assembly protein TadG
MLKKATHRPGRQLPARHAAGQAVIEFAMVAIVMCICVFAGIQSAIIYNAYSALQDLVYQGARYAAVNPGFDSNAVSTYMNSVASPILLDNSGNNLTITMNPNSTPRAFGASISVTVSYSLANKIAIPNPFMGVRFPTSISFTETAMSE